MPLSVSKNQEGFMEEEVRLEWDRIYTGWVGLESHTAVLLPPHAVCGCLLPAFVLLASGLTVALSNLLGTMSSLGQGSPSPRGGG